MFIQISVPSKTFILGEYIALKGLSTLILTTERYFKLIAKPGQAYCEGIHPESPAGKLIKQDNDFYKNYNIKFIDPYQHMGGFGASSAQFIMIFSLKEYEEGNTNLRHINYINLLDQYIKVAWDGKGMQPSGADLIAQLNGGICYFHKLERKSHVFSWPFTDLAYCLIHTANKLATHIHLKELSRFDENELDVIAQNGLKSLKQSNSNAFIEAIIHYADALKTEGLVAEKTQEILKKLSKNRDILAAKGCGALGADVILVIFSRLKQEEVVSWLKEKKLHVITYGQEVAKGLEIGLL